MVCARCLLFRVFLTPLRFSWGDVLLDAMAGHNPLDMDHTLCCDSKLFSVQFGCDQETRNLPIARVRHLPRAIAVGKGGRSLSQPPAITNIFGMPLNTNGALARGVQTI
jgi:hypothetical protein